MFTKNGISTTNRSYKSHWSNKNGRKKEVKTISEPKKGRHLQENQIVEFIGL